MVLHATDFVQELSKSLDAFDRPRTRGLCTELIAELRRTETFLSGEQAREVLSHLRRYRLFAEMQAVADTLIQCGQQSPVVWRQYAQSLLDQGNVTAALAVIEKLQSDLTDRKEAAEARGLIGRAYKQLLVESPAASPTRKQDLLRRALYSYYEAYDFSPEEHLWHGINAVAILARAESEGVNLGPLRYRDLANSILERVQGRFLAGEARPWDLATALEATVALGRPDEAVLWAHRYASAPGVYAFEIASTLRQLTDVWQLSPQSSPGVLLIPLLQAALLKREGGEVHVPCGRTALHALEQLEQDARLEKTFGQDKYVSYSWYKLGLERCQGVARLETKTGDIRGTGFLLRGKDLWESWGDEFLILTNAHVVSDAPDAHSALFPEEAVIQFDCSEGGEREPYRVGGLLFSSPPARLDATLLRPEPAIRGAKVYPISKNLPLLERGTQRVYIIGHPGGRGLALSIQDNLLLDYDSYRIHYRTPTDPGSSGSPVFNQQWDLIGLHHAGDRQMARLHGEPGTYEANEGIWIQTIIDTIREQYQKTEGGAGR